MICGGRKSDSCAVQQHKAQILQNVVCQLRSKGSKLQSALGGMNVGHILPKFRISGVRVWSYWPINFVFLMPVRLSD